MKMRKKISYMWHLLAGFVLSLTGMQQGTAAIPVQGEGDAGNVGNVTLPGPYAGKNHEVAFEGRGGLKTKTAIGVQPDGGVYGFVTREEQLAQNGQNIPVKNKSILYMATPKRENTRGKMLESRPARGVKSGLIAGKPARGKSRAFVDKPAQGKGRSIIGSPRHGVNRGKGSLLESQPAKRRLIMHSPRQGVQPGRGRMLESSPGKSKAFISGGDGSQSQLEFDNVFPLTDEQKEQLVFGSRDYLWELNGEGLLERHLPDGIRVVIREQGLVDVFDSEEGLTGQFHSPAAEKMDRAMRITQEMEDMVREDGRGPG